MSGVVQMVVDSIEYLRMPISATADGVTANVSSDTVRVAIRAVREPTPLAWQPAAWDTDSSTAPPTYYARVLIGAAPFALAAGVYDCYVKVTDNPEVPILAVGQLYLAAQ